MKTVSRMLAMGALALAGCSGKAANSANEAAGSGEAKPGRISLPLYDEAVTITRPVLPARMADGDCPSSDACEFGTEWRTCQAIPLYREAAAASPILRQLKAMETFIAESGEIELVAPGRIEITDVTYAGQTGGQYLEAGAVLEAYGPLHDSRALYFNPANGKAFSPPANEDQWWWDGKNSRMTAAPKMNWWVRAKAKDGARGWIRLASTAGADSFPLYQYAEILEAWDIHRTRDDETPDCNEMLKTQDQQGA